MAKKTVSKLDESPGYCERLQTEEELFGKEGIVQELQRRLLQSTPDGE